MKYNINKLCGINNLSVRFDENFDDEFINKLINLLNNFEIKEKNKDSIWLKLREKDILVYKYGEIVFLGFSEEDVKNILNKVLR
ncbi:MAG: hypothetical protein RXQ68_00930 [Candidatus Nanopusillus sp.]